MWSAVTWCRFVPQRLDAALRDSFEHRICERADQSADRSAHSKDLEVASKKVLVIGAGRSGIASARFLAAHGAIVALNDQKPIEKWSSEALELKGQGVGCLPGEIPGWLLDHSELLVISPGVPTKTIPVRYAERAGAEIIGEVELASRYLKGRTVAITGTNGKTTTTALIGEILKDAGLHSQVGGNIGTPLISLANSSSDDGWTVAELSSFQLETDQRISPIGCCSTERYPKSYGSLRVIY